MASCDVACPIISCYLMRYDRLCCVMLYDPLRCYANDLLCLAPCNKIKCYELKMLLVTLCGTKWFCNDMVIEKIILYYNVLF